MSPCLLSSTPDRMLTYVLYVFYMINTALVLYNSTYIVCTYHHYHSSRHLIMIVFRIIYFYTSILYVVHCSQYISHYGSVQVISSEAGLCVFIAIHQLIFLTIIVYNGG